MPGLTLELIVNDGALWGMLAQLRLNQQLDAVLGSDRSFDVDLGNSSLTLGGGAQQVSAVPHLIASVAPGPQTVRWGWALAELGNLPATGLSGRLRDFGRAQQVPALGSDEVPFSAFGPAPEGVEEVDWVAEQVGILACQVIGEVPWFVVPAGDTRVVLLLQDGPALPAPELAQVMTVLPDALMAGRLIDPPRALQHLLGRVPNWHAEWGPAGVRISDPTGNIDVHLDQDGQVTEIQTNI